MPWRLGILHRRRRTEWGQTGAPSGVPRHGTDSTFSGVREMVGRYERASASPAMAAMFAKAFAEIDVRNILQTVHTSTLVLARPGDLTVPFEATEGVGHRTAQCHVPGTFAGRSRRF